jgi:hypothetical protein
MISVTTGREFWAYGYYMMGLNSWALSLFTSQVEYAKKAREYFRSALDTNQNSDAELQIVIQDAMTRVNEYLEVLSKGTGS